MIDDREVFIPADPSKPTRTLDDIMADMLRRTIRVNARQRPLRSDPFARFARWLGRRLVAWGTRP